MSRVQIAPLISDLVELARIVSTTPIAHCKSPSPEALKRRQHMMKRRERRMEIVKRNLKEHLGNDEQ